MVLTSCCRYSDIRRRVATPDRELSLRFTAPSHFWLALNTHAATTLAFVISPISLGLASLLRRISWGRTCSSYRSLYLPTRRLSFCWALPPMQLINLANFSFTHTARSLSGGRCRLADVLAAAGDLAYATTQTPAHNDAPRYRLAARGFLRLRMAGMG